MKEYWAFVVTEVGNDPNRFGQTICGTDNEVIAFEACMDHEKPAFVMRTNDKEIIYRNF